MARLDSFSADDDAIVLLLSVCYTRPLLKRLPLLNNCPCLPTSSLLPSRCKRHFSNWRSVPAHLLPCLYICLCGEKKQQKILTKKMKKNNSKCLCPILCPNRKCSQFCLVFCLCNVMTYTVYLDPCVPLMMKKIDLCLENRNNFVISLFY